jgi:hypothetical protein
VEIFLIAFCLVVFLVAMVVFSPVVVAIDSRSRQVRVRWLFVLEFLMPLPWTAGEKRLYVFRKPVALKERERTKAPAKPATGASRLRKKRRALGRFFMRCLGDSTIRRALARQLAKLVRRIFRSVDLSRWASDVSLPDPAFNGMLAGALAGSGWGNRPGIRVNFAGENSLFIELRFHPHRVFKAFLFFLPYRAMFRIWRALPAARPQ